MSPLASVITPTAAFAMLANHVWQSTCVLLAIALLAWTCRRHRAQVRYWIWFAGSVKFLLPVGLLVAAGSRLGAGLAPAPFPSDVASLMDGMARPFSGLVARQVASGTSHTSVAASPDAILWLLLAVWLCGSALTLIAWVTRWQRMRALARAASPLLMGPEIDIVRRLERRYGIKRAVPLLVSAAQIEPALFGIRQPALLWPRRFGDWLTASQLEAILTHEFVHLARRDNLTAALHMLVQALFWFHPGVWMIGRRLLRERERACDEAVLGHGSEPRSYAEGILKISEFAVHSRELWVSGVTGSDLETRIETIMTYRTTRPFGAWRTSLIGATLASVIIAPLVFGALHAAPPTPPRNQASPGRGDGWKPAPSSALAPPLGIVRDGRYAHVRTGLTFDVPAQWAVQGTYPSSDNGEMVIMTTDAPLAQVAVWMSKETVLPSDIGPWLDDAPFQKLRQRSGDYRIARSSDYRLRDGSIRRDIIAGHDAIVAIADYQDETTGEAMAESMTWIYTEHARVFVFARVRAAELEELSPPFEQMLASVDLP